MLGVMDPGVCPMGYLREAGLATSGVDGIDLKAIRITVKRKINVM